jgi:hypothetical protein
MNKLERNKPMQREKERDPQTQVNTKDIGALKHKSLYKRMMLVN